MKDILFKACIYTVYSDMYTDYIYKTIEYCIYIYNDNMNV